MVATADRAALFFRAATALPPRPGVPARRGHAGPWFAAPTSAAAIARLATLAALLAGCFASSTAPPCVPGEARACRCEGDAAGAQVCEGGERGFGACVCLPAGGDAEAEAAVVDAAGDATVDAPDAPYADALVDALVADADPRIRTATSVACPTNTTHCGRCVDRRADPLHCGACGRACAAGEYCSAGTCVAGCAAPRTTCNERCVDTQTDVRNCGACGQVCLPGQACTSGACTPGCGAGTTYCGDLVGCLDLSGALGSCGRCGASCTGGHSCIGGTCVPSTLSFDAGARFAQGLFPNPAGAPYFPTFLAHVYGAGGAALGSGLSGNRAVATQSVCLALGNASRAWRAISVVVSATSYSADLARTRWLAPAGASLTFTALCLSPAFDSAALAALRTFATTELAVTLFEETSTSSAMTRISQPITMLPGDVFTWDPMRPCADRDTMDEFSAVWVRPHDPVVEALVPEVEAHSVFPGGFGAEPYVRAPYERVAEIPAGGYGYENVYLEAGEALDIEVLAVAGGVPGIVDLALLTPSQYDAWRSDHALPATARWPATSSGAAVQFAGASTGGWYVLTLAAPASVTSPRTVRWSRSTTSEDVAEDVLRDVYDTLAARHLRLAPVTAATFHGFAHLRRSAELLAMRDGSVVDAVMLGAGLIELIAMEPALAYTDGALYLGVRSGAAPAPGRERTVWAVDLTGLGEVSFEQAFDDAQRALADQRTRAPHFHVQDVAAARAHGFLPLP